MNYYPVVVLDTETVLGTARWGKNGQETAQEQAKDMCVTARKMGASVWEWKVVRAETREEARYIHAAVSFEDWTSDRVMNRK